LLLKNNILMDYKEVRIGNWVSEQGVHLQVGMINSEVLESAEPIPLTEEWLISFGFSDNGYKQGYIGVICGSSDFVLTKPKTMGEWQDEYCWTFDNYRFVTIQYVHQLQNLFYLLSHGTELKVIY